MKVLHIFPEFRRGGAPVNTLRFIRATTGKLEHWAAGKGVDTELMSEFTPAAITWDINLTRFSVVSAVDLIFRAVKLKPDIVHSNGKAGTVYGLLLTFLLPRQTHFFLTLRGFHDKFSGLKSRFYRFLEVWMSRRVDAVIAVSHSERRHYLALIRADESKVIVVHNGIEVRPSPLPKDIAVAVAAHQWNIVSISRISHQKDLETMIRAFEAVAANRSDVALHVIGGVSHGDKGYQKEVEKMRALSASSSRIFFWGDRKSAGDLLGHFQLYLSTARFEGLPTAVIEAYLCRLPVVGTACIGNIDLIRSGETGWLAPVGDSEAIAGELEEALSAMEDGKAVGIVEQAFRESLNYSVENQSRRLLELYGYSEGDQDT